ncbi:MAG TPA: UvrD-helicase domain-containing protein [Kofleriaceae bacterium]|jgi:ATP-dependent helicase/nuclease subunit A
MTNAWVEASAGTGKTHYIVERIVELLAPESGRRATPIERIAAITFTRKAAGELRVRTRARILQRIAELPAADRRRSQLLEALGGIDTAAISTIHSFADRLLRRWPAHARLDPQYALVEDEGELVASCVRALVDAAEAGTLGEATATVLDAIRAGLSVHSRETPHWTYHGLDGLVAGFVLHRDVELADPPPLAFDRAAFLHHAAAVCALVADLSPESPGARWLIALRESLRGLRDELDPIVLFATLVERIERGPRGRPSDAPTKSGDFCSDARAWDAWKALRDTHADGLLAPLRRWLATRLVRLRPIALERYEHVKARARAVDHLDLLVKLRDLLRDHLDVRRACQALFDHLFIDEAQDTDPLQAEIAMFLCEREPVARVWTDVVLAPDRLTVVGDPKQSIYRFRRADIGTYLRMRDVVERGPVRRERLTGSRRSVPSLVAWLDARFSAVFEGGTVPYQPLTPHRVSTEPIAVHAVPFLDPADESAEGCRALEAVAMARYVRWLVEVSDVRVADPRSGTPRAIGFGDVGVLCLATTNLPLLFDAFDREGVPYAARGGSLFLSDPLVRRFLLGLCALADPHDGVAMAALLRPPFFALDLGDLARERRDDPSDPVTRARALIRELRRRRFERSPGETARALLATTGIGSVVAHGSNGAQRLAALGELCFQLERRGLDRDFDAVAAELREWVDRPPKLDRPAPVTGDAVQALTIHQAKGLEFPVVVWWDGRASWHERVVDEPWAVARDGRAWAIRLEHLVWEEPAGAELAARERQERQDERKRLVYVAATRARDLLVIPKVGDAASICGTLLGGAAPPAVLEQPLHMPAAHAPWFDAVGAPQAPAPELAAPAIAWEAAARAAASSRMVPLAFSEATEPRSFWGRKGRFGRVFGDTVHLAIGVVVREGGAARDAVLRVVVRTQLASGLVDEAVADVQRAVAAVGASAALAVEYPVSGIDAEGRLVSGYIDLLARTGEGIVLLDFKTDAPAPTLPDGYVRQVEGYATAVAAAWGQPVRAGILYTATGEIRWLS